MNEVRALVEAFAEANTRGERCALATVVSVEGSSYRQPGARLLIGETGTTTGAISAGCLEADVIEHAKRVISTGVTKLIEYNTSTTSAEMAWGLGLGCNGIVRVLVEPLARDSLYVEALRHSCESSAAPVLVATVYRHLPPEWAQAAVQSETGARLLIDEDGNVRSEDMSRPLAVVLESELRTLSNIELNYSARTLEVSGGRVTVFIERLMPPVPLVIFGAGPDALPIVELARALGWEITVVDPQARNTSFTRFDMADHVIVSRPEEAIAGVSITSRTLALLMTHNYSHDLVFLRFLLDSTAPYIGVMGPRARTERMLSELVAKEHRFRLHEAGVSRLYSPAGLDIGANSSVDVALSIVAEMRAVLAGRDGGMLRERRGSIHGNADGERVPFTKSEVLAVALA